MPEGDTVYRAATNLRAALDQKVLTRTQFRVDKYANLDFAGLRISRVWPHGKHLFIQAGDHVIHSHLKMEGAWHTYKPGEKWRKPGWQARVVLEADGSQAVGFSLGILSVLPAAEAPSVTAHLGPDLLDDNWDAATARDRIESAPDRAIGMALLDQRNLAGIGNVYRSELCFLRGLDPLTPTSEVADLDGLLDLSRRMLWANKDRVQRCTTGNLRRGQELWVYGRERKPCRRCGTHIERRIISESGYQSTNVPNADERLVYVCPRCQHVRD
ncbi:DNA-formamidopyrimidine glycosylase family protein [Hoyosella altamirensis]|uniref:DNA-(apurinic or apyrimidinic site) lyase n=1 Tax=Hoyosella altamirensis TaxID=616997 RepID=A0A839RIQ8_9ACTN|nr:DNA-formamidopyrimidine glycosylase family protein [Hoyosella altamirensis]MBB3035921.1 endonuclease-8 [Hoyosella altamirensis]